jgi:hypothetical protein
LATHIAIFWYFSIQSGLFGWNMAIIRPANYHMAQRVPFIPAINNCLSSVAHFQAPDRVMA